jgi:hypothetical protein
VIVNGTTDREWANVAMSRDRQTNTLYLSNPNTRMGTSLLGADHGHGRW